MNLKLIFSTIILIIFSSISYYFNSIIGILDFFVSIGFYTILFYTFHILWRKFKKEEITDSLEYMKNFIFRISIFILVTTSILGGFTYLSNEVFKAKMPEYTISNGEKTVVFQAMVHIASKSFYDKIIENLTKFKQDGGVYFFEGVKPGTEENMNAFNDAIGIQFESDLYENFSKLYGVTFQKPEDFLGLVNDLDFNVDLNINQIVELYNEKNIRSGEQKAKYSPPLDANKEILNTLASLNDRELKVLVYLNQAILNLIIGSDSLQSVLSENFNNEMLFDVILNGRNKVLVDEISKSEYNKIYITYGLLHFKGVLEQLQKQDPRWQIVGTRYLYPID
ncbi:MAG: hypothetical protein PHV23_02070 [Candidatus Gracilibacteria bacterium]|nr:hypothetical protein [Candidatus Gracilibacteria bacterium]